MYKRQGPTDRLVLKAVLGKLIPGQHRYLPLQPTPTFGETGSGWKGVRPVSYTHLRAHETVLDLVCRLLLEKKHNTTHPVHHLSTLVIHIATSVYSI